MQATGLPGCKVDSQLFTSIWINYSPGVISVGIGPAGSSITFQWRDPDPAIPNIRHIGLSCWDKYVSYRNVQLLPPVPAAKLQEQLQRLQEQQQQQQQHSQQISAVQQDPGDVTQLQGTSVGLAVTQQPSLSPFSSQQQQQGQLLNEQCNLVPPLLQIVQDSLQQALTPSTLFHALHLSELLLPRTQQLYDAAVQLAGSWFELLVKQHLEEVAGLSVDVLAGILQEPLLVREMLALLVLKALCMV